MLRPKSRGGVTVGKFGKFDVDQSSSKGDENVTRCLLTCGYIILMTRNISIEVRYTYIIT